MQKNIVFLKQSSSVSVLLLILFMVPCESMYAQKSGWSVKMFGLAQWAAKKLNWYTIGERYSGESAVNGVEKGASYGFELGLEYAVIERLGILNRSCIR